MSEMMQSVSWLNDTYKYTCVYNHVNCKDKYNN